MPYKAGHPCYERNCGKIVPSGQLYCEEHKALHPNNDRKNSAQRGYGSKWQRARKLFLERPENFFCRECQKEGILTRATVVDHIKPHRGDQELFWDESNWQPLCKKHHDLKTWNEDKYPVYKF